jgi:hypothetical protein
LTADPQISFSSEMPNPNEFLADHFLKAAGIAAVYVTSTARSAPLILPACSAPAIASCFAVPAATMPRSRRWPRPGYLPKPGRPPRWRPVREAAAEMGIGRRPHETVIRRAFAAVETVNQRMADLQKTGGMKDMNDEFK